MTAAQHTPDYSLTMVEAGGRACVLSIVGASIDELVRDGYSRSEAVETVEGNQFENAIAEGRIGADAWLALKAEGSAS